MHKYDQINVIPFIDVLLVLLAIVLTTTFVALVDVLKAHGLDDVAVRTRTGG